MESGASGPRAVPPDGCDIGVVEKGSQVADKSTAKGKQVADKGEGVSNRGVSKSLKSKQVPKPASNGNGNIVKRHCRRKSSFCLLNGKVAKPKVGQVLQAVPEKFRVGVWKCSY